MRQSTTPWILALLLATGCSTAGSGVGGPKTDVTRSTEAFVEVGEASYYGSKFQGRRMAGGEKYDADELIAAHRTLPFGTRVRVTNLANGQSVVVVVKDRGPWIRGRVIDLSGRAARELGFVREGVTKVRMEVLGG
jgi:rare lipoprotein A